MTAVRGDSLLSGLFWLGTARVGVVCMNLVATSRLAHALGAENFGINSFAVSYLAYFLIVVNLGFETFLTREIAFDSSRVRELVNSVITMRLLLATGVALLLVASMSLLRLPWLSQMVVLIQGVGLFTSAIGLTCVYQGLQCMRIVALRESTASFVNMVGILWVVHTPDDLVLAAGIAVGTQLVMNLSILVQYATDHGIPRIRLPGADEFLLARRSMIYFWSLVMITITYNTHIVLLGLLRSDAEVGLFSAGWKLFLFAIAVPNLIATLFMPRITNRASRAAERDGSTEFFLQAIMVCAFPIAMFGSTLSPQILTLMFGPAYLPATATLNLLLLNGLVVSLNIGFGTWMTAVGRQSALLRMVALGAGVGVLLNVALIPLFGGEGAALATLMAEMVILTMFLRACPALLERSILGFGSRCVIAVIPATICVYFSSAIPMLQQSDLAAVMIGGMVGVVVYVMALRLAGIDLQRFAGDLHRLN